MKSADNDRGQLLHIASPREWKMKNESGNSVTSICKPTQQKAEEEVCSYQRKGNNTTWGIPKQVDKWT